MTESLSIEEFIHEATKQAESGLKKAGYETTRQELSEIRFELSATMDSKVEGGIVLQLLNAGGSKADSTTQKITIFARKQKKLNIA